VKKRVRISYMLYNFYAKTSKPSLNSYAGLRGFITRRSFLTRNVLAVQKVLSGSGRARRLRLMGKYIGHRLVARQELDNTFWTDSTYSERGW